VHDLATRGYVQALPTAVTSSDANNFPKQWNSYATFGGKQYASPLLASLNGWVFYSPKQFKKWGVTPPTTWAGLYRLTQLLEAYKKGPVWCSGFNADASSGSAGTDWIEDLVLRRSGAKVYDQWVSHKIPFSDPRIQTAFDDTGSLLLDPGFSNAGSGGVKTINTTSIADSALAMEAGTCTLTHQTSGFVSDLKNATGGPANISPNGDYWAFMLPGFSKKTTPVTGGGDFVAAFSNDADTVKVQQYLTTQEWARSRVALGGAVSPNVNTGAADASSPLVQKSYNLLDSSSTVFRFDASDLMPSVVGSGSFWTGMVDWVKGTSTPKVLAEIDAAWPNN
jgi:alpha-glucoside transport system substrate-binding protein